MELNNFKRLSTAIALFSDIASVNLAIILAALIRFGGDIPWQDLKSYLLLSSFITFISPVIFYIFELYDREAHISRSRIVLNAFRSSLAIFIASMLFVYVSRKTHLGAIPASTLMLSAVLTIILIAGWRLVRWYSLIKVKGGGKRLVVLEASQDESPSFSRLIDDNTLVIRFGKSARMTSNDSSKLVADLPSLVSFIEEERIWEVLVEPEAMSYDMLVQLAHKLADKGIQLSVTSDQYEVLIGAEISERGGPLPIIRLANDDKAGWYMNLKRVVDVIVSLGMLTVMFLLYPIVAALIKLSSKGPVIYKQERVGLHGRTFTIYKFRSMYQDAERDTGPVLAEENDPRITPVGRIMRKIRLDELPNFINVLKGEMSLIGPRPERPEIIDKLRAKHPFYVGRLQVKPGVTGWAQVNGNYEDIELKLQHDLYYIENMSPILDLIILLKTIPTVILGKGAR